MPSTLIGARNMREIVITPFQEVHWVITKLEGDVLIWADEGAILILDLEEQRLHKIIGEESYSSCDVVDVVCNGPVTRVKIHIDMERDVIAGLNPSTPFPALARMLKLTAIHQPTRDRIRRLFLG